MSEHKNPPLVPLLRALNSSVRASVERRYAAMMRELEYLKENEVRDFVYISDAGWSIEKLRVLFMLNSVYQICIGPLQSSARSSSGLGLDIPIRHGSEVFDLVRSASINEMANAYRDLAEKLGFQRGWLVKNTAGDVVYWIATFLKDQEAGGDV